MQKISKKRIKNRHFLRKAVVFTIISTLLLTAFLPAFNAEFRNVFYKIKDTSYFSRHDPEPIDSEPAISNIDANPDPQKFGGFVNITCNVTDPDGVAEVFLNITDPNNSYQNFSIKANNTGDVYYCNKTYNLAGKYTFFIWAKDTNENSISSSIYTFVVIRWNVVLSVSESNGKNDTAIFGEVDDARQSIFNGIGLLSNLSRRTQFIDDVLLANDKALETGTRKLFYADKNEGILNYLYSQLHLLWFLKESLELYLNQLMKNFAPQQV